MDQRMSADDDANDDVVTRMGADGDAESPKLVEAREVEAGDGTKEEVVALEWLAVRANVMGGGENRRRDECGNGYRHRF